MNKKLITLLGTSIISLTSVGVTTNYELTANASKTTNIKDPISKAEGIKLLKKAGYKGSQLKNIELLNSSSKMTTINTYKKDQNEWIKNTYTLYPQSNKMVEIDLQSYKGTNKNNPASFQDKINSTGATVTEINRNNYKVKSKKDNTKTTANANTETGSSVPTDLQGRYTNRINISDDGIDSGTKDNLIIVHSYEKKGNSYTFQGDSVSDDGDSTASSTMSNPETFIIVKNDDGTITVSGCKNESLNGTFHLDPNEN